MQPTQTSKSKRKGGDLETKFKDPNKVKSLLTAVLYGPSGSGKTTISSSFPKPLLHLDINEKTHEVLKGVDGISTMELTDPEEMNEVYWWLHDHPEKFRTVVIDSLGQLQDMYIHIKSRGGKSAMTQRGWGEVSGQMKSLITLFTRLPLNVVFIAHDRIFKIDEGDDSDLPGENITTPEVGPSVMPSVAKVLNANVGVLGNTFILENVETEKAKVKGKSRLIKKRTVEYCLRIGPHAVYRSKIRKARSIEVPPYITNPTYDQLVKIIEGRYKE